MGWRSVCIGAPLGSHAFGEIMRGAMVGARQKFRRIALQKCLDRNAGVGFDRD
jgi:hypothetical protein